MYLFVPVSLAQPPALSGSDTPSPGHSCCPLVLHWPCLGSTQDWTNLLDSSQDSTVQWTKGQNRGLGIWNSHVLPKPKSAYLTAQNHWYLYGVQHVACCVSYTFRLILGVYIFMKTLECPLDCKEIKPVNPKGNQPWMFIGRTDAEAETPILWPPDLTLGKDPDAGKDWR